MFKTEIIDYDVVTPQDPLCPTLCEIYIVQGIVPHVIIRDNENNQGAAVSDVLHEIVSNLIADELVGLNGKYYFQQKLSSTILNRKILFNNNYSTQQFDSINEYEYDLLTKAATYIDS
ncbi:hypothetical protein VAS14_00171 [Vibrio angustum S14]|uniref:Uncharacterized protein n=1 Tax=Photobacterium angustum (strain S14 / CCUG 15956) TaxID=314292 RepID=Q1ZJT5_PHOAS|nr:hypothetical protein [Photobacterium angustum]EAS62437.1 hypothetical protein VAS14_00171 [Vibrio angustum S14] [Photobacterium angustum S14]